jgi:hypothetical protein
VRRKSMGTKNIYLKTLRTYVHVWVCMTDMNDIHRLRRGICMRIGHVQADQGTRRTEPWSLDLAPWQPPWIKIHHMFQIEKCHENATIVDRQISMILIFFHKILRQCLDGCDALGCFWGLKLSIHKRFHEFKNVPSSESWITFSKSGQVPWLKQCYDRYE